MSKDQEEFRKAIHGKKVPILVLDQKWHRLFAIHGKPERVTELEAELNALLARQGKLTNDLKGLKKVKNQLMENIVQNMEGASGSLEEHKLEEDRRLIDEANEKIDACEDELLELPNQIKDVNETLMIESMDYFYNILHVNKQESDEIEQWIQQVRIELKKNIIRKQNRDINNREMYSYLHDILGPEVLNLFDIEYTEKNQTENSSSENQQTEEKNKES
jgi:vacuolar-type H+-ATPase subunit I/STV1